mmetsp:Transcript_24309/g.66965  ORF Transcript_24309/g.66965 Transcript_24309/m.66965 type:complete len:312 (+) Transcript_24309:440-1375(+)
MLILYAELNGPPTVMSAKLRRKWRAAAAMRPQVQRATNRGKKTSTSARADPGRQTVGGADGGAKRSSGAIALASVGVMIADCVVREDRPSAPNPLMTGCSRIAHPMAQSRPWATYTSPDRATVSTTHSPSSAGSVSPAPVLTSMIHSISAWQPERRGSQILTARPATRARGADASAAASSPGMSGADLAPGSLSPKRLRATNLSLHAEVGSSSESLTRLWTARGTSVCHSVLPARWPCTSSASAPAQNVASSAPSARGSSTSTAHSSGSIAKSRTAGGRSGASLGGRVVPMRRLLHGPGPARLCARTCAPY